MLKYSTSQLVASVGGGAGDLSFFKGLATGSVTVLL